MNATANKAAGSHGTMSLIDHLTELRKRIIISVVAVAVGAVVAYIFYNRILEFLLEPHCQINGDDGLLQGCGLLARSPLEGFSVRLMVSTYTGVGIAMPIILWQLWSFVAPGLYPQERKYGLSFVVLSFVLFAFGAGLAYWSLPRALEFLVDVGGPNLENVYSPKEYIGFVVKMMLGFGLGFEFPIAAHLHATYWVGRQQDVACRAQICSGWHCGSGRRAHA